jgi:hypothetical protein
VRIVPENERPFMGGPPPGPLLQVLEERLREALGPDTELRIAPGRGLMLVRLSAAGTGYWLAFLAATAAGRRSCPARWIWSLIVAAILPSPPSAARYLARPLRELNAAVERRPRRNAAAAPSTGPPEIVRA